MPDENSKSTDPAVYKQVAPAGLAAEVTSDNSAAPETITALGRWLTEKLGADPAARARVATLSGLSLSELDQLLAGHPLFPVDNDHLQRLATALVEAQTISHTGEFWQALGNGASEPGDGEPSEYLVPPSQILRSMSGNT